jgi:hypothetical protein
MAIAVSKLPDLRCGYRCHEFDGSLRPGQHPRQARGGDCLRGRSCVVVVGVTPVRLGGVELDAREIHHQPIDLVLIVTAVPLARGLHSSTFKLNLSQFWSL